MNTKIRRFYKALWPKLLLLLGFGTTFTFMACYGPTPTQYQHEDVDDFAIIDTIAEDTTAVVDVDMAAEVDGTKSE